MGSVRARPYSLELSIISLFLRIKQKSEYIFTALPRSLPLAFSLFPSLQVTVIILTSDLRNITRVTYGDVKQRARQSVTTEYTIPVCILYFEN